MITGADGYVSLAALRWCKDHQIAVITVNPLGELIAASAHSDPPDAPTVRAQALCGPGGRCEAAGVEIARTIVEHKLARQAETAWNVLGRSREATEIRRLIGFLRGADSTRELNLIEAEAARRYYDAWSGVSITWSRQDIGKVPEHWLTYNGRQNPLSNGNRNAIHPVNAILNYAYRMLEIEALPVAVRFGELTATEPSRKVVAGMGEHAQDEVVSLGPDRFHEIHCQRIPVVTVGVEEYERQAEPGCQAGQACPRRSTL